MFFRRTYRAWGASDAAEPEEFHDAPSSPEASRKAAADTKVASWMVRVTGTAKVGEPVGYHHKSPLPLPGWEGNLSPAHAAALDALRARVDENDELGRRARAAVPKPAESYEGFLLRFLRARQFDVDKAFAMLEEDVTWRTDKRVAELASLDPADVLGCPPAIMHYYQPRWIGGEDKQGRPVVWTKFGDWRVDNVLEHTTHERLIDFHIWEQEQLVKRLQEQSDKHACSISQGVAVVDMKCWGPALMTRKAMGWLKPAVALDNAHYPERNGTAVIINAPYTFSIIWGIVKVWLDDATKAKVQIFSQERYWRPALLELIEADQIPREFGGTNPIQLRDVTHHDPTALHREMSAPARMAGIPPTKTTPAAHGRASAKPGAGATNTARAEEVAAPAASPDSSRTGGGFMGMLGLARSNST